MDVPGTLCSAVRSEVSAKISSSPVVLAPATSSTISATNNANNNVSPAAHAAAAKFCSSTANANSRHSVGTASSGSAAVAVSAGHRQTAMNATSGGGEPVQCSGQSQPQHAPAAAVLSSGSCGGAASALSGQAIERLSRPLAFDKMEQLVRVMKETDRGVPVRVQKTFLTSIPSAFMGYDLIEWIMDYYNIEDSEALNICNQLCLHGYFFPVSDSKTLMFKDDSSLYRFQSPYYWPWQHRPPDNVEYAIYLSKRSLRNKQRHGLEEYETEAFASLHKNLKAKWEIIQLQAEEQVRLAKDRKKLDKIVHDSQERAFWRVYRPPPSQFTPLEPCPIPSRDRQGRPRRRTIDDLQREVDYLRLSMGRTRMKMSQACECLTTYCETFAEYDYFLQSALPSNPWVTDDLTYWSLNGAVVDLPTEKRVRRWAISIEELVSDPTGLHEFTAYLKKEYSHENIRFWTAVNDLRRSAHSQIGGKVKDIYEEFLEPGAPCEINIDGKTMEKVQTSLKSTPNRFTFDSAAEHIYMLLLKKDCYPRFVRSEHYKALLATGVQPPHKKRFFGFGVPKKKSSTSATPGLSSGGSALGASGSGGSMGGTSNVGSLARRRGSDRSLSGSAHELAIFGVRDGSGAMSGSSGSGAYMHLPGGGAGANSKVPHSHSQSNLSDIPYSSVVYRGDMPGASGFPILSVTHEDPSSIINSACQTTTRTGAAVVVGAADAHHRRQSEAAAAAAAASVHSQQPVAFAPAAAVRKVPADSAVVSSDPVPKAHIDGTAAAAAVAAASSVCPWDDPPTPPDATPAQLQLIVPPKLTVPTAMPHSSSGSGDISRAPTPVTPSSVAVTPSTSDIGDLSDRMRRTCNVRQSTVDCSELATGPKRTLEPGGTENRRSSMSMMAPSRLSSEPNRWPASSSSSTIAALGGRPLNIAAPSHGDSKPPLPPPSASVAGSTRDPPAERSSEPASLSLPLRTANVASSPQPHSDTATPTAGSVGAAAESGAPTAPITATPTITVCCPAIGEADEALGTLAESPDAELLASGNTDPPMQCIALQAPGDEHESPTTEEYQECCEPDDFPMDDGGTDASPIVDDDDECGQRTPMMELRSKSAQSPTAADDAMSGSAGDGGDGVSCAGDQLMIGYLPPAPTPAPSIAPLAEIEGADADDDDEDEPEIRPAADAQLTDDDPFETVQAAADHTSGCVRLKARPGESVSRQHSTEAQASPADVAADTATTATPNTVCPWEDE